jgi:hypothetical protein
MNSFARKVKTIQEVIDTVPGFLDQMASTAADLQRMSRRGRDQYEQAHWGRQGRDPEMIGSVPDASEGVVDLGRLTEVAYVTMKGREKRASEYHHRFRAPYPILAFATNGSGLVIVRASNGRSRYTVTPNGIEG